MVKLLKKITFKEFYKINEKVAKTSPMRTHYQSKNPLEKWLWKQKKQIINNLLEDLPIKNIIDLGCGDACLIDLVNEKIAYTGVDISPTQVQYAQNYVKKIERKNTQIHIADILNLEFKDNSFDAALVCDVAEHVLEPERLFKEAKRLIKKNGYIIFCIPNEQIWEIVRALLLRFPLRSPDHIYAIYPNDIQKYFPSIEKKVFLPIHFIKELSLIHIFLVKNVK